MERISRNYHDEYSLLISFLPSANKAAYSGFETQRRRHQKSETGVSVTPKNGHVSNKMFKKSLTSQFPLLSAPTGSTMISRMFGMINSTLDVPEEKPLRSVYTYGL